MVGDKNGMTGKLDKEGVALSPLQCGQQEPHPMEKFTSGQNMHPRSSPSENGKERAPHYLLALLMETLALLDP